MNPRAVLKAAIEKDRASRPTRARRSRERAQPKVGVLPPPPVAATGQPEAAAAVVVAGPVGGRQVASTAKATAASARNAPGREWSPAPAPRAAAAGRPLEEWKAWLRSIVDTDSTRAAITAILADPGHPAFHRVLAWADERGFGKERQALDATLQLEVVRRDEGGR